METIRIRFSPDLIAQRNQIVASLDPLDLDELFQELPLLNQSAQPQKIIDRANSLLSPRAGLITNLSLEECLAVTRDVGMIASSIKRFDLQPMRVLPILEEILKVASAKTRTVPRDTVFSYGPWNPEGDRRRTFTNLPEEGFFIDSFVAGMSNLDYVVAKLSDAANVEISDPQFAQSALEAKMLFDRMVQSMVGVYRLIPPELFTFKLRPFFDPYVINGKELLGPGGAQMPVLLIDQLVWGSDERDSWYRDYYLENIEYSPVEYKELGELMIGRQSLVTRVASQLEKRVSQSESAKALIGIIDTMMAFRSVHLKVARLNFNLRKNSDVGSGGHRTEILELLRDKTLDAKKRLTKVVN